MSISILTASTAIPRFARGKVRAFVKAQPGFPAWIAALGKTSRDASNAQLIEYALANGLEAQVLSFINAAPAEAPIAPWVAAPAVEPFKGPAVDKEYFEAMAQPAAVAAVMAAAIKGPESLSLNEMFEAREAELASLETGNAPFAVEPASPAVTTQGLLANVYQFLSPYVLAELEQALKPVIDAANKPPVVIEKPAPVALAALPAGAMPYAVKGPKITLGKLFGITGPHASKTVHMWESYGAAPVINPRFVFEPFVLAMAATTLDRASNVWLVGPAGSGKSSFPEQIAAYTGRPFLKLTFTRNSHVDDMTGGKGVEQGNTRWEDGPLIAAMRRPGTIIMCDELTIAPAGVQALFQGAADEHRSLTLSTGEVVRAAPGVVFAVADNTAGRGDDTGLYQGTNVANGALVNRFAAMIKVDYMPADQEAQALHNHTGADLAACQHLADFVARARKLPQMRGVILSLRNMTALVKHVQAGFTAQEACEVSILNCLPDTERAALQTLFTLDWRNEFEALVTGVQPAMPATGSDSLAAQAFDDGVMRS